MVLRLRLSWPQIELQKVYSMINNTIGSGLVKFAQEISVLEKEDASVQALNERLRRICFPPIPAHPKPSNNSFSRKDKGSLDDSRDD